MAGEVTGRTQTNLRRVVLALAVVTFLTSFPRVGAGQLATAREYEIKAGFLFSFAKFVDWPADAFASDTDDLRVEVIGHDPFDGALDRLVAGKTIDQHTVVISYSRDLSAIPRGHLVFISASERRQVPSLLAALERTPTLTISDIDEFAERGGVIGLVGAQSVRFVINRTAAAKAGLQVSSKLLSLATLVGASTPPGLVPDLH
jgi:hypothetical protein